jgi:hypothetical protein
MFDKSRINLELIRGGLIKKLKLRKLKKSKKIRKSIKSYKK